MDRFEEKIKAALIEGSKEITVEDNFFERIRESVGTKGRYGNYRKIMGLGIKKWLPLAACLVVALSVTLFSQNLKTFAEEVIKAIFVLEKGDDGSLSVVEKPVSQVLLKPITVRSTTESEEQLAKEIGCPVHFPLNAGGFSFEDKVLGVCLGKGVDYNTWLKLIKTMGTAGNNPDAFASLADYDPYKFAGGFYKDYNNNAIYISVHSKRDWMSDLGPVAIMAINITAESVSIGDCTGTYVTFYVPVYEQNTTNGKVVEDPSRPPKGADEGWALFWDNDNVSYCLGLATEFPLSKEKAIAIAEKFYEAQPK